MPSVYTGFNIKNKSSKKNRTGFTFNIFYKLTFLETYKFRSVLKEMTSINNEIDKLRMSSP